MAAEKAANSGIYIYGIVPSSEAWPPPACSPAPNAFGSAGIDGGTVYTIAHDGVSAVVSDIPNVRIRADRRRLAAHQKVLATLMAKCTVLPISFGAIAHSAKAVRRMLALNHSALAEALLRVKGKVEMGLRVFWDVPNTFEYALRVHPELRCLRDQLFSGGRQPSYDQKIALGQTFERIRDEDRKMSTERVLAVLDACCVDIKELTLGNERDVMNLAGLIRRDAQPEFDRSVLEAAKLFDDNWCFKVNGPWPPYDFVEVDMQTERTAGAKSACS
jgi:hypothetical protein